MICEHTFVLGEITPSPHLLWQAVLWLADTALLGSIVLAMGCLAVRWRRQPVERLRLIEWTIAGCLLTPLLHLIPGLPHWALTPWATQAAVSADAIPNSTAANSDSTTSLLAKKTEEPPPQPPSIARTEFSGNNNSAPPQNSNQQHSNPQADQSAPASVAAAPTTSPSPIAPTSIAPTKTNWPQVGAIAVVAAFAVGFAVTAAWQLLGWLSIWRLERSTQPAPEQVSQLFRQLSGPSGHTVRLRMHKRIELPVAYGPLRPVILLPQRMCQTTVSTPDNASSDLELKYCLAHEWAHVCGGDLWRWQICNWVGLLFFYQPLYWWLRRQLRLSQDFLADDQAAQQSAQAADYANFLVGLARRHLGIMATASLGIGERPSNLRRRINILLDSRSPLLHRLPRARNMALAAISIALIATVSSLRLTAEDTVPQPTADATTKAAAQSMPATAKTSTPKPAAQDDGKPTPDEPTSAKEVKSADIKSADAKDANAKPSADIPAEITLSGLVRDAGTGKPIAGADVTAMQYLMDSETGQETKFVRRLDCRTDSDGKYHFIVSTENAQEVSIRNRTPAMSPAEFNQLSDQEKPAKIREAQSLAASPPTKFQTSFLHFEVNAKSAGYATLLPRSETIILKEPPGVEAVQIRSLGYVRAPGELRPLEMLPGEEISGVIVSPAGHPVPKARVFTTTQAPLRQSQQRQSEEQKSNSSFSQNSRSNLNGATVTCVDDTETDASGHFHILVPHYGDTKLSIWPVDEAPLIKQIKDERGDLGSIVLPRGALITGQVRAAKGNPATGIYVGAQRLGKSQDIARAAVTDAHGNFCFAPLPSGDYRVELHDAFSDLTTEHLHDPPLEKHPLPGFFVPYKVVLTESQPRNDAYRTEPLPAAPEPLDFRPVETVEISGTINFDPSMPSNAAIRYRKPEISGMINGIEYSADVSMDNSGKFTAKVPRGLHDVYIQVPGVTTPGPKWRLGADKPFVDPNAIPLGTVTDDMRDIEIDHPRSSR